MKNEKGITLVALVMTVIILMILVSVSVLQITDDDEGLLAEGNELINKVNSELSQYETEIADTTSQISSADTSFKLTEVNYEDPSGANEPAFISGLKPVVINDDGTTTAVTKKSEWYNYNEKQWANAQSQDNSLWVWIPRFAYKITYTNSSNKALGGTVNVVFLDGTSNNYDNNGTLEDAVTAGYTVHPSFQAASNGDYSNGNWDKNLTGFWVAKFEAGFQQGDAITTANNDKTQVVRSNVSYSSGAVYLSATQNGGTEGYNTARNYIDGIYGENIDGILTELSSYNLKETKISYPVFKGANYAMNYISINDSYRICKALADSGNIYGFNDKSADTHLMKNSEWGAIAYLSYSSYGTDGNRVYSNNVSLNNSTENVYGVTGYVESSLGSNVVNSITGANIWYSAEGQNGSSNHNITGVYDLAGGHWERVAAYVSNGNTESFGFHITREALDNTGNVINTKYITTYAVGSTDDSTNNYAANLNIIGDATVETSSAATGSTSWDSETSVFPSETLPFFARGGSYNFTANTGLFSYGRTPGYGLYDSGFRAVIAAQTISTTGGQVSE